MTLPSMKTTTTTPTVARMARSGIPRTWAAAHSRARRVVGGGASLLTGPSSQSGGHYARITHGGLTGMPEDLTPGSRAVNTKTLHPERPYVARAAGTGADVAGKRAGRPAGRRG